jgi:hypothetical protein
MLKINIMAEQGHGDHWECVANLADVPHKILSVMLQKGDVIEKVEVMADCFGDGQEKIHTVFSISQNANLSAFALIVSNEKNNTNEVVSAYPAVRNGKKIELKITCIKEWPNGVEAIIEGETENEYTISFFDTQYFKNKDRYKIGKTYVFAFSALAYSAEELPEKSFSFEGQQAIDWLAKIGNKPDYDKKGNVQPVVFDMTKTVAFLPHTEYPDDAEFQSPVSEVKEVDFWGTQLYKLRICIFRDPDICIDLYAKTSFFEHKPEINDPVRGLLWLQGYLYEETKQQSGILDFSGEPIIH